MILAANLYQFLCKLFLLLTFLISCSPNSNLKVFQGEIFGTTWQVKYFDEKDKDIKPLILNELKRIDSIFSTYKKDSYISKVNRGEASEFENDDFLRLINLSLKIKNRSNGAFNVFLNDQYDLNAIAKGYAVDTLSKILKEEEIIDFMIEIGGEMRFEGQKGTHGWSFALIDPLFNKSIHKDFKVKQNISIATSGDYRNPGHIIDPLALSSINTNLLSVSVLNESSTALADAWATALYATSNNKWIDLANSNNLAAYFIYQDLEKIVSSSTLRWDELVE